MSIILKSNNEIEQMRKANVVVARVLNSIRRTAVSGVPTFWLDKMAEALIYGYGAVPAFKGYKGNGPYPFPRSTCTSINDEVVHGIPSKDRILKDGDILSVDCGVLLDGFYGDAAITIPIGKISDQAKHLLMATVTALELAITKCILGNRVSDISRSIQEYVESTGFSVVRDFVGHGVGRSLHEEPKIPNYVVAHCNERLQPGMVLAIEPMVNIGSYEVETAKDGWTQKTKDGSLSAHFEHSVAITKAGPVVLSRLPE